LVDTRPFSHKEHSMGLMDSLMGAAGNAALGALQGKATGADVSGAAAGLDPQMILGLVRTLIENAGGLPGLLAKLQQAGLGEAVQSWIGTGANLPVSADQIGQALGPNLLGLLAQQLGGNPQQAASTLADLLPGVVDQLTPQGQLPTGNGLGALGALLGGGAVGGGTGADVVGMLGGLLSKR
jgi:uncharacterized protein YidB (DUF937 family)